MFLRDPQAQIIQTAPPPIVRNSNFSRCCKGNSHEWSKIESVADTADLIIDARPIHCVGINPAGASLAHDFGHSIEHTGPRVDASARISDKEKIGLRVLDKVLNAYR